MGLLVLQSRMGYAPRERSVEMIATEAAPPAPDTRDALPAGGPARLCERHQNFLSRCRY